MSPITLRFASLAGKWRIWICTVAAIIFGTLSADLVAAELKCKITSSASPLSQFGNLRPGGLSEIWLQARGDSFEFNTVTGRLRWGLDVDSVYELMPNPVPDSNDLIAMYYATGSGRHVHKLLRIRIWKQAPYPFVFLYEEEVLSGICFGPTL